LPNSIAATQQEQAGDYLIVSCFSDRYAQRGGSREVLIQGGEDMAFQFHQATTRDDKL
jgi:hypothetical protein